MKELIKGTSKKFVHLAALGCGLFALAYITNTAFFMMSSYKSLWRGHHWISTSTLDQPFAHEHQDSDMRRFEMVRGKLQFLYNFKSPCFLEKLPDKPLPADQSVYSNSAYLRFKDYTRWDRYGGRLSVHELDYPQGVLINDTNGICSKKGKCRLRCLPYFLLIGVAKSGTTDFYSRLISHPLVYSGSEKELFYWSQYRFQINASLSDYSDLFDKNLATAIKDTPVNTGEEYYPFVLGDFTPVMFTDDVWWRDHPGNQGLMEPRYLGFHDMHNVLPDAKLIVMLRNPSTRLYSSYNMFRINLKPSPQDFHDRVAKSIEWWHNCTVVKNLPRRYCAYGSPPEMPPVVCVLQDPIPNNRWYGPPNVANYSGAIRRGMYSIFVKDWYSVYSKEQILILKTEEYSIDPLNTFTNVVLPFLHLPQMKLTDMRKARKNSHSNSRSYLPMLPETRKLLDDFYRPFNEELAEFLGDNKWLWND